jgi:signal transduction histidine kinase
VRPSPLVARVAFLALLVAAVVGASFVVFLIAVSSLRRATDREARSKDVTSAALRVENLIVDMETGVRGYVLTQRQAFLTPYRNGQRQWPAAAEQLRQLVANDPTQTQRVRRIENLARSYDRDYAIPVLDIAKVAPDVAQSPASTIAGKKYIDDIRSTFDRILAVEASRSRARSEAAGSTARRAELAGVASLVISVGLVLLFGLWVVRSVARPVREASDAASGVAAGDFSIRLPEEGVGEVAALGAAFNSMTRSLEEGRRALLEQNERLQESERHKSDLISMVSHELRTPLSSVLGFTALLMDRDFPPDERRRYLEIIDAEARRLGALAEDFLDVRLLEEGRFDLRTEPVEVVTLVREQVLLFFGNARDHRMALDVPLESVVVEADRDRLAQVIGNLLSNAIKYSPHGGEVAVAVRARRGTARVTVIDHGIGIPLEYRDRIFEKFFRGGAASAGIAGTGLGLAVAREIVEAHGGEMGFTSTEGGGSTFWLELPLSERAPDDEQPVARDRESAREPSRTPQS